jgi:MscS family membrane protein
MRRLLCLFLVCATALAAAESPLQPVKTDSPRDTMRSFLLAMDRYAEARHRGDRAAAAWLDDAMRTLDLSRLNPVSREATGRQAAMYLKEVIDRIIVVDPAKVPDDTSLTRWRLKDSEITILRQDEGDRRGEFLFSPDSVERAPAFFARIRDLPLLEGTRGGGFEAPWQDRVIPPSLRPEVFGVAYWQWILIFILIFIGLVVRQVVRFAGFILSKMAARTAVTWDDDLIEAMIAPVSHLATTGIWFASLHLLGIGGTAYVVIAFLIKGAFFVALAFLAYRLAGFLGHQIERTLTERHKDLNAGLLRLVRQSLKVLAVVFCALLGAQNMGLDVASLIAGLGIGGLAFALAAKDTLANLFGSVMIMIDRPFRVGDYIVVKGVEGTVEEIGFRCTRLRSPANSLVSVPNSELVLANIDNLGLRPRRRVKMSLGLVYSTPPERIEAFCEGVKNIIRASPKTARDAIHVAFEAFSASSLDVLVLYHIETADWGEELLHRQNISLEILRLAGQLGVGFAYPTQTLHIESTPERAPAPHAPLTAEQLAAAAAAFGPGGSAAKPDGHGLFTPNHRQRQ